MVRRLAGLELEGQTLVCTNGSTERVKGWWQAGYSAWFGDMLAPNFGIVVPLAERQSVSTGELRGVLYPAIERIVVVLDSEYVHKGITVWSEKWWRNGWRVKTKETGHRDPWE